MKDEINPLTNPGHCKDHTANKAINNADEAKRLEDLKIAVTLSRAIFRHYGFSVIGRISLMHDKTGKVYR